MRYMVLERFVHGARPVYERAAERGRMLPDGLVYLLTDEDSGRVLRLAPDAGAR